MPQIGLLWPFMARNVVEVAGRVKRNEPAVSSNLAAGSPIAPGKGGLSSSDPNARGRRARAAIRAAPRGG
jgi:hypothetical protein